MTLITGSGLPEEHLGTGNDDTILAYGGDDTLYGYGGNDSLNGGSGNDHIYGGENDTLVGGPGDDRISGDSGRPAAFGGDGNDVIDMDGGYFPGSGTSGRAFGGTGDDIVSFWAPVTGARASGGDGTDLLAITTTGNFGQTQGGYIDFSTGTGRFTGPGVLSLVFDGFERLFFQGNTAGDTVIGGGGDDVAYLYDGDNVADMGGGNDTVALRYGGQHTLEGGAGDDLLVMMDAVTPVYFIFDTWDGSVDDGQLSQITGFERFEIYGSLQNDVITTGNGADRVTGDRGDDTIEGNGGADSLFGGAGRDEIHGGAANDVIAGGAASDTIYGGDGFDVIHMAGTSGTPLGWLGHGDYAFGGNGNDRFNFRDGSHTATGGAGVDFFNFWIVDDPYDFVTDFVSGQDRIRIAADQLEGAVAGAAVTVSAGALVGTAAQFLTFSSGGIGYLAWDPDGTGALDATVIALFLNGAAPVATDITLF